jgi:hypothetical protein
MLRQELRVRPMDVEMDAVPRAPAAYETTDEPGRPSALSVMPAGAQMAPSPTTYLESRRSPVSHRRPQPTRIVNPVVLDSGIL